MRFIAIFLVLISYAAIVHADELDGEFIRLHGQVRGFNTNTKKLEAQYLNLLEKYKDPKDVGRIYYKLADMYLQSGFTDAVSPVKYAKKALEYPLQSYERIRVGHMIAGALIRQNSGKTGKDFAEARRQIVRPLLEAIKYSLDIKLPAEVPPPSKERTGFYNIDYSTWPDMTPEEKKAQDEERKAIEAKQKTVVEDGKKRREIKECLLDLKICNNTVVSIYSKKPYAMEELRKMAMEILQDKGAVDKLVARVEEAINERPERKQAMPPATAR